MNNELKSEDKEILQSLNRIVNIIKDALDKEAIDAAFFCSLSIPDIMGQFCYPELREYTNKNVVGKRYVRWYDEHVFKYENPPLNKNYNDNIFQNINQIDGTILYAIRCKYFHQGSLVSRAIIKCWFWAIEIVGSFLFIVSFLFLSFHYNFSFDRKVL